MGKNAKDRNAGKVRQNQSAGELSCRKARRALAPSHSTGVGAQEAKAQVKWDLSADVVIIGGRRRGAPCRHHGARSLAPPSSSSMKTTTSAAAAS